jgi:hypothetical protein
MRPLARLPLVCKELVGYNLRLHRQLSDLPATQVTFDYMQGVAGYAESLASWILQLLFVLRCLLKVTGTRANVYRYGESVHRVREIFLSGGLDYRYDLG